MQGGPLYLFDIGLSVVAFKAVWLVDELDCCVGRMLFRRASQSFPAIWSNDHQLMDVSDVMIFVDAINQTGLSLDWNERRRMNARNASSIPALTALRMAFFER